MPPTSRPSRWLLGAQCPTTASGVEKLATQGVVSARLLMYVSIYYVLAWLLITNKLQQKVLYMIIVNMPTNDDKNRAESIMATESEVELIPDNRNSAADAKD